MEDGRVNQASKDQMMVANFGDSLEYMDKNKNSGNVYFSLDFDQAKLVNDPSLENRAEYQFENGAVYRG